MTIPSPERHLLFVAFTNSYLMIGIGEIQLGKSLCLIEPIQQLANQRQRISVFSSDITEGPIIYAKTKASIWLPVEVDRCFGGGFERLDKAVG